MPAACIVVMPACNEQECIREVCREWLAVIQGLPGARLLVVDDGSTDGTPAILERLAGENPALLVVRQPNAGHGRAILHGYRRALEMGCEWVFQVDSDGQFRAQDFSKLWACAGRSRFVLGRRAERKDDFHRRWLSKAHRLLVLLLFGTYIQDPNIPFRLMAAPFLSKLLSVVPETVFAPNVFLSILAAKRGQDLCEIPVVHLPRRTGAASIRPAQLVGVLLRCLRELVAFRVSNPVRRCEA
jgi:glycosyltransferase involved in cell wall biosynthesis